MELDPTPKYSDYAPTAPLASQLVLEEAADYQSLADRTQQIINGAERLIAARPGLIGSIRYRARVAIERVNWSLFADQAYEKRLESARLLNQEINDLVSETESYLTDLEIPKERPS